AWINTGLSNFESTHAGWSHSWASAEEMAAVEAGIDVLDYFAWVVNEPTGITTGNGDVYNVDPPLQPLNRDDVGGAVFNITYTAHEGAHQFNDLHWVQAYNGIS